MKPRYLEKFIRYMVLYGVVVLVLAQQGSELFEHLHLFIDTSNGILSLLLAMFLMSMQYNMDSYIRRYLVIGFGFAAFTEILHALVGIEWSGHFAWVSFYAGKLRPATWPPSTYVLPLALGWMLWMQSHKRSIDARLFALGVAAITLALMAASWVLPKYVDTGILGIQRPTQFPLLLIWGALIVKFWRLRALHPLYEGMAWLGVMLLLSDLCMLYSTSPHEKFTMMAHAGKMLGYMLLHEVQMRLAADDSLARTIAEDELRVAAVAFESREGVVITDRNSIILRANQAFGELSGYPVEALIGRSPRIFQSGHFSKSFYESMWEHIQRHGSWEGEITTRKKDGSYFSSHLQITAVTDGQGAVTHYVGGVHDISERKRHLQELEEARQLAEAAARSQGQFLANMSHEIRTPMNAIIGLLTLLRNTPLNQQQLDYASKSAQAARSLLGLLNDILDFSKVEAGKMELEREPIQLDGMLRDLSVILSANLGPKSIEVLFDLDPRLPPTVLGDAMRLQQVLTNLGSNAIKFTPKGQVVVALQRQQHTEHSVAIRFSVQDSGIGIAPEHHEHIFTGFSQAEASTTRKFGGTGLGLAICRKLVALMGSRLELKSAPGEGSTFSFTVTFPTVEQATSDVAEKATIAPTPQRVLIIEDNPVAARLAVTAAASWGAQATVASSADAAMTVLDSTASSPEKSDTPFSCVLIDCQLTPVDGWETAARIRHWATQHLHSPPHVVMLSANGRETLAQRTPAEQDCIDALIVKPYTPAVLREACMAVDGKATGTALRDTHANRFAQRQLAGMRILVVEDNLINQQVAEELLNAQGAMVSLAANGQLGVEAVRAAAPQFDVVLMDIQMPVLDGYGATSAIRQELGLKDLPIVAMTANAMSGDRENCLAAGMNEHIGKPFDVAQLVSLLIRLTGLRPDPAHAATPSGLPAPSLPQVPGIAVDEAIARMSGMRSLYIRTAKDFCAMLQSVGGELASALAQGDRTLLTRGLHTLKGNAGTLGASELAREAARLEKACTDGAMKGVDADDLKALDRTLLTTNQLLTQVVVQLESAQPVAPVVHPPEASRDNTLASLETLTQLTANSDLQALELFADIRTSLSGRFPDQFPALEEALHQLDMPMAQQACQAMLAALLSR